MRRARRVTERESGPRDGTPLSFSGEVWTDARGCATVALPAAARGLGGCLEYALRPLAPGVTASLTAELNDGRFTLATNEPHVKVAWRVTGRQLQDKPTSSPPRKEER